MKAKKKLSFIDKFFLWLNYGFCLALLISYLAPIMDPKKYWIIAFFGLAYPPLLLGNLLLIVYWGLRRKIWILVSVLGILCGFNILMNHVGFRTKGDLARPPGDNVVRVMTYNVHSFRRYGAAENDRFTRHELLEIIANEKPDVLGIEEYYTRKKGAYAMTDSIKQFTGLNNYYVENFSGGPEEVIGIAIFSRFPVVDKGLVELSPMGSGNQCLFVDVNKNGRMLRFYAVHLQSIKFAPEDYRYIDTVTHKGKPDLSSTKRLGVKLKNAFFRRSQQLAIIKQHMQKCPYPYIIAGDFNDTPSSFAVNQMAKGLKNAFREKGSGLGRTYNGDFPNYQIDYIMATPSFDVANYRVIEKKLSDHYPVRVDLVLK